MSATNTLENQILLHYFNNNDMANIGDATGLRGSTTAGNLHLSLHTADPGETGDQTTSETAYTSYARAAVARSSAGWTVTANSAALTATISFPACTGGTSTITHFGVGRSSSGVGTLDFKGAVTPNISVSSGVTPQLGTGTAITAD